MKLKHVGFVYVDENNKEVAIERSYFEGSESHLFPGMYMMRIGFARYKGLILPRLGKYIGTTVDDEYKKMNVPPVVIMDIVDDNALEEYVESMIQSEIRKNI